MQDTANCTVILALLVLANDYIPSIKRAGFDAAFAAAFPPEKITAIRKFLLDVVKKVDGVASEKIAEAELTQAWVRFKVLLGISHLFDHSSNSSK